MNLDDESKKAAAKNGCASAHPQANAGNLVIMVRRK
jgi:hypothetical protein